MFIFYLTVTFFAVAANLFSATCDFVRYQQVSVAMARAGVSEKWMTPLGIVKVAGAVGLLAGITVPLVGMAAASGLVLFFVGALVVHLRAHDYSLGPAIVFLLLAIGALALRLAVYER